jgi:hypothetical protein
LAATEQRHADSPGSDNGEVVVEPDGGFVNIEARTDNRTNDGQVLRTELADQVEEVFTGRKGLNLKLRAVLPHLFSLAGRYGWRDGRRFGRQPIPQGDSNPICEQFSAL